MYKIYFASTGYHVSQEELKDLVEPIGTINSIKFLEISQFPAGYQYVAFGSFPTLPSYRLGLVEMASREQAESAIDLLQGIKPGPGRRLMFFGPHGPGDEP